MVDGAELIVVAFGSAARAPWMRSRQPDEGKKVGLVRPLRYGLPKKASPNSAIGQSFLDVEMNAGQMQEDWSGHRPDISIHHLGQGEEDHLSG